MFLIIYEVNTKILNFAFCILHLGDSPINYNLSLRKKKGVPYGTPFCGAVGIWAQKKRL